MQNTSVIYATRVREVAAFLNRSRFPAAVSRQVLQSILPGGAAFKEFIQNGPPERQDGVWEARVEAWANRRGNAFVRLVNGQPCGAGFIEDGDTCHVGVTPEQDAAYAKAVKAGDTATAQKMVDAAAKASKVENPGISSRKATIARLDAEEQELWDIHPTSQVSKENFISGDRMDALAREERRRQAVLGSDRYAEIHSARNSLYKAIAKLQKQTPTFPVVTRDAQGNVIPLSKRFNKASNKISNRDDMVTATVLGQSVTVAAEPTEAQKESGSYKKGAAAWNGLSISVENLKGGVRSGTNSEGATWATVMPASYGYIVGSEGADGEEVDVYIGDAPDSSKVFVIDQMDAETGEFDEHKAMLAFPNLFTALSTYHKGFSDGRGAERVGDVTPMTVDEFKAWLKTEDTTQPVSDALDNDAPWMEEDALSNKPCGKSFIGEEMECHIGETAPTKDAPVAAAAPAAAPKADKAGKTDSADAKPMSTMAASGQIKMVKPKSIEEVGKLLGELKAHVETAKALPDTDKMKELKVLHALQQQQRAIGASRKLSDKIGEYLGAQPEAAKTAESPKSPEAAVKSAEEKTVKPTAEEDAGKAAVTALKGGGDVVLKSVKEVNTAIEEIHKFANEAKKSGEKVNLNLCKVSVPGTNLFCGESLKGDDGKPIPRSEMPQLAGFPVKGSTVDDEKNFPKDKAGEVNVGEAFVQSLLKKGVKTEDLDQPASSLKASQSELKGSNVAFMMSPEGQKAVGLDENSIFVSRDGYVIDGHHRWAAKIGLDAKDGKFGDTKIKTRRIDMDIKDVLKAANKFTKEIGIAPKKLANAGNCGTGDGGFKAGNTCATGSGEEGAAGPVEVENANEMPESLRPLVNRALSMFPTLGKYGSRVVYAGGINLDGEDLLGSYEIKNNTVKFTKNVAALAHECGHAELDGALTIATRELGVLARKAVSDGRPVLDSNESGGAPMDYGYWAHKPIGKLAILQPALREFVEVMDKGRGAHPSNYSKSFKDSYIVSAPEEERYPVKRKKTPGDVDAHRGYGTVTRKVYLHVHEAYAEFMRGILHKEIPEVEGLPSSQGRESNLVAKSFDKMGSKESRAAFLKLRKAIHELYD